MIMIRSLLRAGDGSFRDVHTFDELPTDPQYVEGALDLTVDDHILLGPAEWDYLDQLWAYIVTMAVELRDKAEVSTFFPDQPIELSFRRAGDRVIVDVDVDGEVRTAGVPQGQFRRAIAVGASDFFAAMRRFSRVDSTRYETILDDIAHI